MSPLKATVNMNGSPTVISVSVGKANTIGCSRRFNVHLEDIEGIIQPVTVAQYIVTGLGNSYGVIRCDNDGGSPIGMCATLAGCQVAVLSDFINYNELEIIEEQEEE